MPGILITSAWALNDAYGQEEISIMAFVGSIIGVYLLFGIVLMIFAKPLSRLLFKENEKVIEEKTLTATTLIQATVCP